MNTHKKSPSDYVKNNNKIIFNKIEKRGRPSKIHDELMLASLMHNCVYNILYLNVNKHRVPNRVSFSGNSYVEPKKSFSCLDARS